jgi:16S rRNA (guanine966-N2)-methyltransferase
MRVIGGSARGAKLESPRGRGVRPTLDRVREALFNILGDSVVEANVLDLYAGTGAIGIEALSRGAKRVFFVDESRDQLALVERNLVRTHLRDRAELRRCDLPNRLPRFGIGFDIVYADPPRAFDDYQTLIDAVCAAEVLGEQGVLVLEIGRDCVKNRELTGLRLDQVRRYGDTDLAFFS